MADTIPGDTSTTATISVGGTLSGTLETGNDHDWYKVTLTAGQSVTITIDGLTLEDSYLRVWDSSGANLLFSNDDIIDGTNRDSQVSFSAPSTGTYYIDVGSFDEMYSGTYQVSIKPYTPPPLVTNDQIADQLVYGFWGGESQHFNVTQGGTITVDISTLNASEQNLARAALAEWTDIIGVKFQEVTTGASADIQFDHSGPGMIAQTDSDTVSGIINHSHVHISTGWVNNYGTGLYTYSFQTYIHEIGHALGLGHAGNYNGNADYPYDALFQNDAWSTSVMSYFDQHDNTYFGGQGFTVDYAVTPMAADILAMQTLYGLSTTTRTGDTTYGFNTNAGGIYDASAYPKAAYTIFDSGGNDTLDFSGAASNQVLNLNPETFSNVNGQVGNISIARGVVIENAIGGGGADTIIGNAAANVIRGNGGADTLTGGGGNDSFLDTKAGHNGDVITDFTASDKIIFSDAVLAGFTASLSGSTLTYTGGTLTISNLHGGTVAASVAASGGVQLTILPHDAANDFNGDGRSDFLLRDSSGWLTDWLGAANGGFANNGSNASLFFTTDWKVAAVGDFNGDGRDDILLRSDAGWITNWLGTTSGSFTNNGANTSLFFSTDWHVVGNADFNGDGRSDLLLRNDSGWVTDWLGTSTGGFANNGPITSLFFSSDWKVAGTGDFNGDGLQDMLLRNDSGWVTDWLGTANGGFTNNGSNASMFFSTDWKIAGTGDFNGDGRDDLLLRNDSGWLTEWLGATNGGFTNNGANATAFLSTDWHIASIGDVNGDARDDLVLRNDNGWTTDWLGGANGAFANNGANFSAFISPSWHIQDPFL